MVSITFLVIIVCNSSDSGVNWERKRQAPGVVVNPPDDKSAVSVLQILRFIPFWILLFLDYRICDFCVVRSGCWALEVSATKKYADGDLIWSKKVFESFNAHSKFISQT